MESSEILERMTLLYPIVGLFLGDILHKLKLSGWILPVNMLACGILVFAAGYRDMWSFILGMEIGAAATGIHGIRKQVMPQLKGAVRRAGAAGSTALILLLAASTTADAADGLTPDSFMGGPGFDWITRSDGEQKTVTQLQLAYAYDTAIEPWYGLTAQQRVLVFPGNQGDNPADWLTELSLDGWYVARGVVEFYAGVGISVWGANIDGGDVQVWGPRGGMRWGVGENVDFEVGYRHYSFGEGDRSQRGLVFGPRFLIGNPEPTPVAK